MIVKSVSVYEVTCCFHFLAFEEALDGVQLFLIGCGGVREFKRYIFLCHLLVQCL